MPLYEYECEVCGHRFEVIQKFSDAPIEKCPACGGAVHKLQSAPAFQFKGTGWYVTDYAKSGSASETKSGKDAKEAKDGKEGSDARKTDSTSSDKTASADSGSTSSSGSTTASSTPASKSDAQK